MADTKFKYKLVTKEGEFRGAYHIYKTAKGDIAVGFTTTMAYIMEDSQGIYSPEDIKYNIEVSGLDVEGDMCCKEIYNVDGKVNPKFDSFGFSEEDEADIRAKLLELVALEGIDD